tara:strand:+ start:759 stop:1190 length:432 start_codon:yes stop_codon:yes gene_type:complete
MSKDQQSLYHQLLKRSRGGGSSSSGSGQYGFRGKKSRGGRFHSVSSSKKGESEDRGHRRQRERAVPVVKEGRLQRIDDSDRDLAYQPPDRRKDQAVAWSPPSFWDIMADLGLRVVEVGIASIAQEIAYFFTRRRFMPRYLRKG